MMIEVTDAMRAAILSPVYPCLSCSNDTNCHVAEELFWVENSGAFYCEDCSYEYYGIRERTATLAEVMEEKRELDIAGENDE